MECGSPEVASRSPWSGETVADCIHVNSPRPAGSTAPGRGEFVPLAQVEQRWRAAAKENRARLKIVRHKFQLADERGDVAVDGSPLAWLGIKGAIRAFLRAEWDVNIKAFDMFVAKPAMKQDTSFVHGWRTKISRFADLMGRYSGVTPESRAGHFGL